MFSGSFTAQTGQLAEHKTETANGLIGVKLNTAFSTVFGRVNVAFKTSFPVEFESSNGLNRRCVLTF